MSILQIFLSDLTKYIIPFFVVSELVWFFSTPLTSRVFTKYKTFTNAISGIFGWVTISFLVFFIVHALSKYNLLTTSTIFIIAGLFFAFNLLLFTKSTLKFFDYFNFETLEIKFIYYLAFFFIYVYIARNPEIYQIERFMDFGFIQTLLNSKTLPLQDVWMAGQNTNYYYFGHFIAFIMCKLTFLKAEQIFFLATCWTFATLSSSIYIIAKNLAKTLDPNITTFKAMFAATTSMLLFAVSGPLFNSMWFFKYLKSFTTGQIPFFWYADATRIIPGTIGEFPMFSFLEASMHAHVWGFISAILVLAILCEIYFDENFEFSHKSLKLYFLSFCLGISFTINSWDLLSLSFLSLFILLAKFFDQLKRIKWFELLFALVANLILMGLTVMHWYLNFETPITGVGWVVQVSDFKKWLWLWGGFVPVFIIGLGYLMKLYVTDDSNSEKTNFTFLQLIFLTGFILVLGMEVWYIKDILTEGPWYRANTYFKVTTQVWTWISLVSGVILMHAYNNVSNQLVKAIVIIVFAGLYFFGIALYPIRTFKYFYEIKEYKGLSNPMEWLMRISQSDFEAYKFLNNYKNSLPKDKKLKIIVEAAGDSYKDNNYFSIMLGWPTIVGWPVHEWTWRGSYSKMVEPKRQDVYEIYAGKDEKKTQTILRDYNVDFIIVGTAEKNIYKDEINYKKLAKIGNIVFSSIETSIIKVKKPF